MKKKTLSLILALAFISASVYANNNPSIYITGVKTMIVDTKAWKSAFVSLEIKNENGISIFEDKYSTQKSKRINFENLPAGKYSLVLENDFKSTEQFFTLSQSGIWVSPNELTVFKPMINVTSEYIDLNYLAPGKNTTITISDDSYTFFNYNFEGEISISKRFDTSELPSGNYTITVSSNDSFSSKSFRK